MTALGYTHTKWHAEHIRVRARLFAHWLESNLRENLQHDRAREKAEKQADKGTGKGGGRTGVEALFPGWKKPMPPHANG